MQFDKFTARARRWCNEYLYQVSQLWAAGEISGPSESQLFFPNILLVTKCSDYYVAELIGARPEYHSLTVKRQRKTCPIEQYFGQFERQPDVHAAVSLEDIGFFYFYGLCLVWQQNSLDEIRRRFPQFEFHSKTTVIAPSGDRGQALLFGEGVDSGFIGNSMFVSKRGELYRCKNILAAFVARKGISDRDLSELFVNARHPNGRGLPGVHCVIGNNDLRLIVAGQLQSMYYSPAVGETTIGKFLETHPEVAKRALDSERIVYEPWLKWIDHDGSCADEAIKPDIVAKRADGFYDIYDLKLALLGRQNIAVGKRKRRKFLSEVASGFAQLANYREYFDYPANAAYAKSKYDVEIQCPRLILVVGSSENVDPIEIEQASRMYDSNFQVLDYDSFCHLFLGVDDSINYTSDKLK